MNPDVFNPDEMLMLRDCLVAIKTLPICASEDFEGVFGLTRAELESVEMRSPNWDFYDEGANDSDNSWIAINNTFAYLINGTSQEKKILFGAISYSEQKVRELRTRFDQI